MNDGNFFRENGTKILLAAAFGLAGLLIVTVGFVRTVFVGALVALGYFIGRVASDREMVRRFMDRYLGR